MKEILTHSFNQSLMITFLVFVMMMLVDYINVLTKGKLSTAIRGGRFRQYAVVSFLSATPGCLGAFANVSFYVHGLISFGAIVGGMIATSGDEAFVMLALFPGQALLLFGLLFIIGIIAAAIIDKLVPLLKITPCEGCELSVVHQEAEEMRLINLSGIIAHFQRLTFVRFLLVALLAMVIISFIAGLLGPEEWGWEKVTIVSLFIVALWVIINVPDHYLEEHIWQHIAKEHLWKVFFWSFGALLAVGIGLKFWNLEAFVKAHMFWVLLIASLVAIIPESGPHLIFVMMFAKGLIPFSVLLASSIIQDGHGMLPLLSYTVKDSIRIKLINFVLGLGIGLIIYSLGW